MIEVPQPLAEAILRYLASKPYAEVAGIIAELQACRSIPQQDAADPKGPQNDHD